MRTGRDEEMVPGESQVLILEDCSVLDVQSDDENFAEPVFVKSESVLSRRVNEAKRLDRRDEKAIDTHLIIKGVGKRQIFDQELSDDGEKNIAENPDAYLASLRKRAPEGASKRRKRVVFEDEPQPLSTITDDTMKNAIPSTIELGMSVEQNLLDKMMSQARKRTSPVVFYTHSSGDDECFPPTMEGGGVTLDEATQFLSTITHPVDDLGEVLYPKVEHDHGGSETNNFVHTGDKLNVPVDEESETGEVSIQDVMRSESEPLVRRGVGATLKFLERLGIRPKLAADVLDGSDNNENSKVVRFKEIRILHHDDDGNILNPTEAYKHLSHRFHGLPLHKNKLQKELDRRVRQRRIEAAPLADTPLATGEALRRYQKETGQSHVVLAVGNRAVNTPWEGDRMQDSYTNINVAVIPPVDPDRRRPRIFGMK